MPCADTVLVWCPRESAKRSVIGALCVVALAGCAVGTDAALTAQDAQSKLGVKDRALTQLATTELRAITTAAQSWLAANGSMAGFAADLTATQPSVASTAKVLTDSSASVATGDGRCLTSPLPSGPTTLAAC